MAIDRRMLAVMAFAGHIFGLWLAGYRLGPAMTNPNRLALALTAVAMVIGGLAAGGWGVLVGWLIGHFAWGSILSWAVLRGKAGFPAKG